MAKATEQKFDKSALVKSNTFKHQADLVNALLEDDKQYSIAECEELINKYLKGKVE